MKKANLKDKDILLLTAAIVSLAGVFSIVKKLFSPHDGGSAAHQHLKHCHLKLRKETIQKHLDRDGTKIRFEFTDDNGRIKLNFIGCDPYNKNCVVKKMDTITANPDEELENIDFGVFTKAENNQTLQELLTSKPIRDWYLKPLACQIKSGYVSYLVADTFPVHSITINPCPPSC
jgi:hypothetical protein